MGTYHEDLIAYLRKLKVPSPRISAVIEQAADAIEALYSNYRHASDALQEYKKAEAEGRLVVLPCKPGDTVYAVHNNNDACATCRHYSSWFGTDVLCDNPEIDVEEREYPNLAKRPICEKQFMEVIEYRATIDMIFFSRDDFGKTVFLTREEAEAALRMDGDGK